MPLCLLSIHTDDATVDVALPAARPVSGLLPDVVALTGRHASVDATRFRLLHPSGTPVDEHLTLTENGIRDGDALLLVTDIPIPPRRPYWDAAREVAVAAVPPTARVDVGSGAVAVGLVALCWAGLGAESRWVHLAVAAVIACATTGRGMDLAAVAAWAVTGCLVVPPGVVAGNVLVAAAAAGTAAVLLIRLRGPSATVVAATCFSALAAVGAAVATAWSIPVATAGVVLATTALGTLGLSGRLAVLAAADPNRAHAILDGLVVSAVLAATLGAVLVAVSAPDGRALAFTAALAAVLAPRARSHVDPIRRLALLVGGTCCATAGLVVTVLALPSLAPWAAALLAAAGLAAGVGREPGPMLGRIVDAAEYVAIAAVIPLACWVAGLYAAARGWHLP